MQRPIKINKMHQLLSKIDRIIMMLLDYFIQIQTVRLPVSSLGD